MANLNCDITPGELAFTIGDGVLINTCPIQGQGSRIVKKVKKDFIQQTEVSGEYKYNQTALVLAVVPYEENTGQEFVAVFVMVNEMIGWMWAHELYARQPCP